MKAEIDLEGVYLEWVKGKSLRYLAAKLQKEHGFKVTHTSLFTWLNQRFGDQATDLIAMSLQRSLLEDYENSPLLPVVEEWVKANLHLRSDVQHRSKHSIRQLTLYQTCPNDEILEFLTPQDFQEERDEEADDPIFLSRTKALKSVTGKKAFE